MNLELLLQLIAATLLFAVGSLLFAASAFVGLRTGRWLVAEYAAARDDFRRRNVNVPFFGPGTLAYQTLDGVSTESQ
jgi:hypothetical protein